MGDSLSSYYDDLEQQSSEALARRQKTVPYWRERALRAENQLKELVNAMALVNSYATKPLSFDPVFREGDPEHQGLGPVSGDWDAVGNYRG
jgi:hypothetical protein